MTAISRTSNAPERNERTILVDDQMSGNFLIRFCPQKPPTETTYTEGKIMGYPNSKHIEMFVKGKTIENIVQIEKVVWLTFTNGEQLCLAPYQTTYGTIIATPYKANGLVKQSKNIKEDSDG